VPITVISSGHHGHEQQGKSARPISLADFTALHSSARIGLLVRGYQGQLAPAVALGQSRLVALETRATALHYPATLATATTL
jgi:hypothetical protein